METRPLGASNLRVSLVGLGCNQFGGRLDFAGTKKVIDRALDLGITHIDTADIYGRRGGSEELVGRALGARRKDVVLVTKFAKPMSDTPPKSRGSRVYVMSAVEASLKRLNTDWIDLLFMHEPDPSTPVEETFRAIEDLKKAGNLHFMPTFMSDTQMVLPIEKVVYYAQEVCVVIATDRYISFWEARNRPRTIDYPFTVIDMRINREGVGEGKMSMATKITASKDKKQVELENYGTQPVLLQSIKREAVR